MVDERVKCTHCLQAQQPGSLREQDGRQHLSNNGHVMIAVDTIYPSDMPPSIDDDRYGHEKLNGYHQNGMLSAKASRDLGRSVHAQQTQPVVDLSVPVHHQSQMRDEHMGLAPSAPRQGQDIFDTWCAPAHLQLRHIHIGGGGGHLHASFTGVKSRRHRADPSLTFSRLAVNASLG